jgi:hypothetical protein
MNTTTEQMDAKPGILPESGLRGKRTTWARQYREPWESACALSLQELWKTFSAQAGTMFEG